jgi:ketosteroid isomerase-like protein
MPSHHFVRQPLAARERASRTVDQRLLLRSPRLAAASSRLLSKLSPESRLRQALLGRAALLAGAAYNRRDLEAVVIGYSRDFEYRPARRWAESGLIDECYRGLEGYRRYVAATAEVFGAENHFYPVEVIDMGSHAVLLADTAMRAQASGVPLTEKFAYVMTFERGTIIRLEEYYDHDEAIEAARLL